MCARKRESKFNSFIKYLLQSNLQEQADILNRKIKYIMYRRCLTKPGGVSRSACPHGVHDTCRWLTGGGGVLVMVLLDKMVNRFQTASLLRSTDGGQLNQASLYSSFTLLSYLMHVSGFYRGPTLVSSRLELISLPGEKLHLCLSLEGVSHLW